MSVQTFTHPATRPQNGTIATRSGTWAAVWRYCFLGIALALGLTAFGCATYSGGDQNLNSAAVAHIKKGVTTESQVIAILGQPDSISIMGDGGRMMTYTRTEGGGNDSQMGLAFIPIAGAFIPEHTSQTSRTRMLQIIVGKNHVVQDYQYSDNASQTDTTSGIGSTHMEQRAITPTTGP